MTYEEGLRWLYALQPRGIRLELDRMRAACALRGDPQRALRVVHVTGTNGKGSTCATIESILRAAGLRTGLYTSPHLHSFCERIRIDGVPIATDEVAARLEALRAFLARGAPPLTFFEVTTLLAFEAFRDARCDVVVLEVGLGGRLDATNVVEAPLACAITGIALDHERYLGTTLAEIAAEKAGILKAGVPAVVGPVEASAWAAIAAHAARVGAPLVRARPGEPHPSLPGDMQRLSAAIARAVVDLLRARGLAISDDAIACGLRSVRWPGRLETVEGAPAVLLDAAHNPDGCRALAAHLASLPRRPTALVFGAMADKDWRQMLDILSPHVERVFAAAPRLARAERPETLALACGGTPAPSVAAAVELARDAVGPEGLVVVAGSIFVLAEARAHILGIPSEPAIPL